MSTLRDFHWMWQLLLALTMLAPLGGCLPSVRNTKVPFPETIWLDGLVPYKLDKSFKIKVEELLDQRGKLRSVELLEKLRQMNEFEQNNNELKAELKLLFANIPYASNEPLRDVEKKSNAEEIANEISITLEPLVNIIEEVTLYADEIPMNGSTVMATNETMAELIKQSNEQLTTNATGMSDETGSSLDDITAEKNIIPVDQSKGEVNSYVLIWDDPSNISADPLNDTQINRTLELEMNNASINSSLESSANMSEIFDPSLKETTTNLSEQSNGCSLIEELLETPGGNASIFEHTLLEVSTQWQPWQKAHIAQLTRQVHHIMTLHGVDMSHKIEAVQRLTALDLWRNRIVKRMLLPYRMPNFGSLQKFFICLWQL